MANLSEQARDQVNGDINYLFERGQGFAIDRGFVWIVRLFAFFTVFLLFWIGWVIFRQASPAIRQFGWQFLISTEWDVGNLVFGALPYIYGTLVTSSIALLLAIPIGLAVAIITSEDFLPTWIRSPIALIVELLAAIPSVIVGLWGFFVFIPALLPFQSWLYQRFSWFPLFSTEPLGPGILPAGFILAIMVLPTIAAISRDTLLAVPRDLRSASMSLGATRWETIFGTLLPAATSGIIGAVTLALGRALGETMAVTMVIGNSDTLSLSLLNLGNTIPAVIANQFPEAQEELFIGALMYLALLLFVLTLGVNVAAVYMVQKSWVEARIMTIFSDSVQSEDELAAELSRPLPWDRALFNHGMTTLTFLLAALALSPLLAILFEILRQALPIFKLEMLFALPAAPGEVGVANGFGNAILGTLIMVGLASLLSVPIGIMTAVFLSEFGRGSILAEGIRFVTTVMSGIPSIVVGLFAYGVIVIAQWGGKPFGFSAIAGAVALAVLMLPIVVLSTEEALKLVPGHQRLASAALGGTSFETTFRIVLAGALPGITTGVLLAVARAAGETAPLLFTALFSPFWPQGLRNPIASMSVLIYNYYNDPSPERSQLLWAAALVLVAIVLAINILSRYITRKSIKA